MIHMQIDVLSPKEHADVLPLLFSILYENMNPIAPIDEPYEVAVAEWVKIISRALSDNRRTLLLVRDQDKLVGFFMYAVNRETGLFLMEEIQFIAAYQGCGLFRRLYAEVLPTIPDKIVTVEAYAHRNNRHSQVILSRLGLSVIGENRSGNAYRFRGHMSDLRAFFG